MRLPASPRIRPLPLLGAQADWNRRVRSAANLAPVATLAFVFSLAALAIPPAWSVVSTIARAEALALLAVFGVQLIRVSRPHSSHARRSIGGCSRFATNGENLELTRSQSGLIIGRDGKSGDLLRYDGTGHLVTVASPQSGKCNAAILPNLLALRRAVVCIDPDGEAVRAVGAARRAFGPVHVLDPFGITGITSAAVNPLDALDPHSFDLNEDIDTLVNAIFIDDLDGFGAAARNSEARHLIACLIHIIIRLEPPERRHLGTLLDYLRLPFERFDAMLRDMRHSGEVGSLIAVMAKGYLEGGPLKALGVHSRARRQCDFLNSSIQATLRRSTFSLAGLRDEPATVFLVLPSDHLSTYSRWLRLLICHSLAELVRSEHKSQMPVLFLLDEFALLGKLGPVDHAMAMRAGSGVQLWSMLHDLSQAEIGNSRRAGALLANAAVVQVFGVEDEQTARLVSSLLGQETAAAATDKSTATFREAATEADQSALSRPLLCAEEIRALPPEVELVLVDGQWPTIAARLDAHRDGEFRCFIQHEPAPLRFTAIPRRSGRAPGERCKLAQ